MEKEIKVVEETEAIRSLFCTFGCGEFSVESRNYRLALIVK